MRGQWSIFIAVCALHGLAVMLGGWLIKPHVLPLPMRPPVAIRVSLIPGAVSPSVHSSSLMPLSSSSVAMRSAVVKTPTTIRASHPVMTTKALKWVSATANYLPNERTVTQTVMSPTAVGAVQPADTVQSTKGDGVMNAPSANAPAMPLPPVTPPRFEAAYLHNPAPPYPPLSKQLAEQGQVILTVEVSTQGQALQVGLHKSSGYPRLDYAAQKAVREWRFIPARRGEQVIVARVLVPVIFRLIEDE